MTGWKRTFWAVWVANCVTALGMQSFLPFFPGHLEGLGVHDPAALRLWSGAVYGAAPLVAGLLSPAWGMLGDRFGRKLMVLRAMGAVTVFVGAMAFARTPAQLLALRVGQGVFAGFVPPSITLASIGAPADRQGRVAGSLSAALSIGSIVGPVFGALIGRAFGTEAVFFATSALAGLGFVLVLALAREGAGLQPRSGVPFSRDALVRGIRRDAAVLSQSGALRRAVVLIFTVQLGLGAASPLLELFAREVTGEASSNLAVGVLFGAMAAAGVVSMPLWGRYSDRVGHARALRHCALSSSIALLLHAVAPSYGVLLVARVLLGLTAGGIAPVAFGVAAAETPLEHRGAAFGTVFSARALAVAGGAYAGALCAAWLGLRGMFVVPAIGIWIALLVLGRGRSG